MTAPNKTIGECVIVLRHIADVEKLCDRPISANTLTALADALERCDSPVCSVDSLVVLKPGQHVVEWCDPLPLGAKVTILDSEREAIEVIPQAFVGEWLVVRSAEAGES